MQNAKNLVLALLAALALAALAAPAAQAEEAAEFWADAGAVKIDATSESTQLFTLPGKPTMTCHHAQLDALYESPATTLTGENVLYTDTKFTKDTSEYCHIVVFGVTLPVTVYENDCHLRFEAGTYLDEGTGSSEGGVIIEGCNESQSITIEVWNANHETPVCTFHIPEQTVENVSYYNILSEGLHAITIEADDAPIQTTVTEKTNPICPQHETTTALYNGAFLARATEDDETYVDATVLGIP